MVDFSAIGSAVSSLKAAKDIAEAMIGLRDEAVFRQKLIEFQSKIIDANNDAFAAQEERAALIDRIRHLEQEVASFKAWEAEKQKYELAQIAEGTMAYALRPDLPEPSHWICPTCYERGQKQILQLETRMPGRVDVYICHGCGAELYTVFGIQSMAAPEGARDRPVDNYHCGVRRNRCYWCIRPGGAAVVRVWSSVEYHRHAQREGDRLAKQGR